MKLYKRKGSPNWYLRDGDALVSLGMTNKVYAQQLLEEYQAKRLGVVRVSHRRLEEYVEPYLKYCEHLNKETTIDDKRRTL